MKKITLLLLGVALSVSNLFAARVVAYATSYGNENNIQYDKITDLVYGFADVSSSGAITIQNLNKFNSIVTASKNNAVNLHLSIGGDGNSQNFSSLVANNSAVATFATNINNLITTHGLAGVDIDWEFPANWQSYQLAQMLKAVKEKIGTKELAVAVAALQYNTGAYTNQSDPYIDFYNLMVYDNTAEANHSSYSFAQQSINYWVSKGFSKSKMRLGLPFYGKGAGKTEGYNTLSASAPSTAYNADYYNGWYYNGKATIQKKCNLALSEGLNGVMIWEITQDRTDQYSLIGAVSEIMKSGISCAEPKLGFTKSLCGVSQVVLDPGVSGTNFSYKWSKDNAVQSGKTAQTYTATTVGTYCVDYIHTPTSGNQCATKTSCVDVQSATSVDVENVETCKSGDVTLKVLTPGAYKWFNTASGGTSFHAGEEYTTNLTSTKTYYVEKPAVSEVLGKTVSDVLTAGDALQYEKVKIVFDAKSSFTLDYVTLYYYADSPTHTFTATVYDKEGKVVGTSAPFKATAVKEQRMPVGIDITAGDGYQLAVTGGPLWVQKGEWGKTLGYPYTKDGIISITGAKHDDIDDPIVHWYPAICDWEVSAGASCGRTAIKATLKTNCQSPVVAFIKPSTTVSVDGSTVVDVEVTATDADGIISSVDFVIKKDGADYKTLTGVKSGDNYATSFTPTESGSYEITATVIDDDSNETTKSMTSVITIVVKAGDPVVTFTKPSANVSTDGKSAIDLEVTATDADGTISTVSFVVKKDGVDYKTLTGVKSGDNYAASFTAIETGNYTITAVVTDNDNNEVSKTATSSISATIETGLDELAQYGVQVYPNPFDNALKIDLGTLVNSTVVVYSIQGQEVITLTNINGAFEIGQDLQSGVYVLQIITDNHVVSSRIVKQ